MSITFSLTGPCSWFGGPDDIGVAPDEGLALYEVPEPPLFLFAQPPETSGLARRLNPDAMYIACRWDYDRTPKEFLTKNVVSVRAENGAQIFAYPVDWGPDEATGRIADVSPGLMRALGITTGDIVTVTIPVPEKAEKAELDVRIRGLTPDEARGMRCCGPAGCGAMALSTVKEGPDLRGHYYQRAHCIADSCMAWRWRLRPVYGKPITPDGGAPGSTDAVAVAAVKSWQNTGTGFCGLAGVPKWED